ncbi:MAG: PIN domain-containing protein [Candidatus Kapaibacterium sp.]
MKLIDTNSLIVLIIGLMNPEKIKGHKRTSIYDENDFHDLVQIIENYESIVTLPNIWTEVDNLLNDKFKGEDKNLYVRQLIYLMKSTTEKYFESRRIEDMEIPTVFYDLGLTDALILECAKQCDLLITSDSRLSDYARAYGIKVYDMKDLKSQKLETP